MTCHEYIPCFICDKHLIPTRHHIYYDFTISNDGYEISGALCKQCSKKEKNRTKLSLYLENRLQREKQQLKQFSNQTAVEGVHSKQVGSCLKQNIIKKAEKQKKQQKAVKKITQKESKIISI
jgi:hypothetical protein